LIWRDAIQAWLRPLYEDAEGALGITMAAVIVTIVVVFFTILLAKLLGEPEK
jgi:hypothetical protein